MDEIRSKPHVEVVEDAIGRVKVRWMGASESALLSHLISVCNAIARGEAENRHENVAIHYLQELTPDEDGDMISIGGYHS